MLLVKLQSIAFTEIGAQIVIILIDSTGLLMPYWSQIVKIIIKSGIVAKKHVL